MFPKLTVFLYNNTMKKISVIIPAYNEEGFIKQTIINTQHVLNSLNIKYEIIVVDNNSTDNTFKIARDLGITVIKESKQGIAYARNSGAKIAKNNILLFIDADTKINLKAVQKCLLLIQNNIKTVSSISKFNKYPTLFSYGIWFYNAVSLIFNLGVGQFIMIHKSAFEKVNGFNTSFFAFEELEFFKKVKKIFGNKSMKVIPIPVETSSRKFDGKKDQLLFLFQLIGYILGFKIGTKKSKLGLWYKTKQIYNPYDPLILNILFVLLVGGFFIDIFNLAIPLFLQSIVMTIIFILFNVLVYRFSYKFYIFILFTLIIEILGQKFGIPFGVYSYNKEISIIGILDVPLFIPFAWSYLIIAYYSLTNNILLTATLVTLTDIPLELFATNKNLWLWSENNILVAPLENFISWFIISLFGALLLKNNKSNYPYIGLSLIFLLIFIGSYTLGIYSIGIFILIFYILYLILYRISDKYEN